MDAPATLLVVTGALLSAAVFLVGFSSTRVHAERDRALYRLESREQQLVEFARLPEALTTREVLRVWGALTDTEVADRIHNLTMWTLALVAGLEVISAIVLSVSAGWRLTIHVGEVAPAFFGWSVMFIATSAVIGLYVLDRQTVTNDLDARIDGDPSWQVLRAATLPTDEAVAAYSRAIDAVPAWPVPYILRARALLSQEPPDIVGAIADFTKAIDLDPSRGKVHAERGVARAFRLDPPQIEGAIVDFTKAIELDPSVFYVYVARGDARVGLVAPDVEAALADYGKAIDLEPSEPSTYAKRGFSRAHHLDPPDLDGAISDYDRLVELEPVEAYGYAARADVRLLLDPPDHEQAIADYDKAVEIDPHWNHPFARRGFARATLDPPDAEGAIVDYTVAIELDSSDTFAYAGRGDARKQLDPPDLQGALADYDRLVELEPVEAYGYAARADVRLLLEPPDVMGAIADRDKALEFDRGEGSVVELLDSVDMRIGNV